MASRAPPQKRKDCNGVTRSFCLSRFSGGTDHLLHVCSLSCLTVVSVRPTTNYCSKLPFRWHGNPNRSITQTHSYTHGHSSVGHLCRFSAWAQIKIGCFSSLFVPAVTGAWISSQTANDNSGSKYETSEKQDNHFCVVINVCKNLCKNQ